jgi:hypothetical protein
MKPKKEGRVIIPLLKEGLALHWNALWLVFFGLFAAIVSLSSLWQGIIDIGSAGDNAQRIFQIITDYFTGERAGGVLSLPTLIMYVAIVMIFFFLGSIAQAAIIDTARKARQRISTTFRAALAVGRSVATKVFLAHLLLRSSLFVITIVLGAIILAFPAGSIGAIIVSALFFLILFVLSLALLFVSMYTVNALVISSYTLTEAFADAIRLTRAHWLLSFEVALVFIVSEIVIGIAWIVLSALLFVPFMLLGILSIGIGVLGSSDILITFWFTLIALLLFALTGAYTAWSNGVWTLLYLDLKGKSGVRSFIARVTDRFRQ